MIRKKNNITGPAPTGTETHPRTIPHVLATHVPPPHTPTTHRPSHYHSSKQQRSCTYRPIHNGSTAVQQYAPQRYTCGTPGAAWDLHFLTILHLTGESASRHLPSTHHSPPTHPPTNPPPQQYNNSGAVRIDQSTTAAQQYDSMHHSGAPVGLQEPGAGWDLHFPTILHLPGESASRRPPSIQHPSPTHWPTHHHSSTTTVEQ